MQSLIMTLLILAVLVLIWHVRELWGEVDLLKAMERKTQESQENLRKEFNDFLLAYRQERILLLERVKGTEESLDEIKDSAIERNEQEAMMFQGITNMMNYDPSQAVKAVKGDA